MIIHRWWGVQVGRWHLTWYDLWDKQFCFEFAIEPRRQSPTR